MYIDITNVIKTLKDTKFEFYKDCYSIKIVSDNGCMEDYDNALSHDYKHIIKEIIDKLYKK